MTYMLCLAHYCDLHGPTPLMVTEGIPTDCSICYEKPVTDRPRSSAATLYPHSEQPSLTNINETLQYLSLSRSVSVPTSEYETQGHRQPLGRGKPNHVTTPSTIDTPPDSPRPVYQQPRRDSSFRRTYDETVTRKQGPCENCAMTMPRRQERSSKAMDGSDTAGGPTLRTRAPAERVFGTAGQASPPSSQTSSDTDGEHDSPRRQPRSRKHMQKSASSRTTSCSTETSSSDLAPFHVHYIDYTSTHEPVLANSFTLLRAACLRALSFETLPRAPPTSQPNSPITNNAPSFVTTHSAGSSVSGGPIFFGDALAGYTTAYIFRIPDIHARGHKRVYAFLALSTHRERLAMKTFAFISNAFRELANQIQQLAEAEAERVAGSPPNGSLVSSSSVHPPNQRTSSNSSQVTLDRSESSFLTGGSAFTRRMGGGGGISAPKARGLAELVGQSDFFIELHKKFVHLLFEVGVTLNS